MRREPVPEADDPAYRDYLLEVLKATTSTSPTGTEEERFLGKKAATPQDPAWLAGRFKQSFTTTDNAVIGANLVACEVLRKAMVEDMAAQPGDIPPENTTSQRAQLDALVAATGNSREKLASFYCIGLHRSDLETTTRIRENIRTLQQYLSDGPITHRKAGFLPFFLYKEEWRLQKQTPFFSENHRGVLQGSFTSEDDRLRAVDLVKTALEFKYAPGVPNSSATVKLTSDPRITGFLERLQLLLQLDVRIVEGHRHLVDQQYRLADDAYRSAEQQVAKIVESITFWVWGADSDGSRVNEARCTNELTSAESFRSSLDPANTLPLDYVFYGGQKKTSSSDWMWTWNRHKDTDHWSRINIANRQVPKQLPFTAHLFDELARRYDERRTKSVGSLTELQQLEELTTVALLGEPAASKDALEQAIIKLHDELISLIPHQYFFTLPICRGSVAQRIGDYPGAARRLASVRAEMLMRGSMGTETPYKSGAEASEADGDLPWGWDTNDVAGVGRKYPYLNGACENRFMQLKFGALYLEWADSLYRTDEFAEVSRAQKLYEAVLRLHGITPSPAPTLDPIPVGLKLTPRTILGHRAGRTVDPAMLTRAQPAGSAPPSSELTVGPIALAQPVEPSHEVGPIMTRLVLVMNPALLAQQQRARLALTQIAAGANYFGYRHDMVPLLRYRSLVAAAQHYATSAERAEADAIQFANEAARAELGLMRTRMAVTTAGMRIMIESERIVKADDERLAAEVQVGRVRGAIEAKRQEIGNHSDLCGQIGDWFSGIKNFFSSRVPKKVGAYVKSDASAALGLSKATAGATAGLGVVGGMALWGIGNGITLSGMADEANARVADLKRLEEQDLFLASAALDARKRELAIAQGQKVIAELEARVAEEVYRYSALRSLNRDTWNQMAIMMRSVLRRYLELGAMTGWLAERALSYEQDRNIRVMRLDYDQPDREGLLGSAQLRADLGLLEAEHITGFDATVPLTWTVSLAQQYPLQFGQLKSKGRCTFRTGSADLRLAFAGSHSHRLRAIEVLAVQPVTNSPLRGTLRNDGISAIASADGASHNLVRPADALPLSEFRLVGDHLAIYELPNIGLMPFEGSGFDTSWALEFPPAANPGGLASLLDVCITFHLNTEFSDSTTGSQKHSVRRTALFSASQVFPEVWSQFRENGGGITFDLRDEQLGSGSNRRVTNVGVFLVGSALPDIVGSLKVEDAAPVEFTIRDGLAHSTQVAPPATVPGAGSADLDALFQHGSIDPRVRWSIELKGDQHSQDLSDLWLGVEYIVTFHS